MHLISLGERYKDYQDSELKNNNEILALTQPWMVEEIHEKYLRAGADIIETNTFNGTWISQADFKLEKDVYEMVIENTKLARKAADKITAENPEKRRLVAGAVGPCNRTASLSPKLEDPAFRNIVFEELVNGYREQIEALVEGGAHIIMVETVFDSLNCKAAGFAYTEFFEDHSYLRPLPLILSCTIIDQAGRNLSGQNIEAFYISMMNTKPFCVGLNCALGADAMKPLVERLSKIANCYVHAYPNAGLPNAMGGYDETPEHYADSVSVYAKEGLVNMLGGCCGTTPIFIQRLAESVAPGVPGINVRHWEDKSQTEKMMLSGLQEFIFTDNIRFINVGERCNIAGSLQFKKMIKNNEYDKAVDVAKK